MAETRFNISNALKEVFGIYGRTPLFTLGSDQEPGALPKFQDSEPKTGEMNFAKNLVAPMTGVLLQDRFGFNFPLDRKDKVGVEGYFLPVETVLELERAKIIVKTNMQGRDGSVKEYISMDDWSLNFKGFFINYENDLYPEEKVETLLRIYEKKIPLKITSKWLSRWGIERVVMENISFPTFEGFSNVQPFELRCLSDDPITLTIE